MYPLSKDDISWCEAVVNKVCRRQHFYYSEDLLAVGRYALLKCSLRSSPDVSRRQFKGFARERIRGAVIDYIRRETGYRTKLGPVQFVSLDRIANYLSNDGTEQRAIIHDFYNRFLLSLTYEEAYIVDKSFREGYTNVEIGKMCYLSQARISQILTQAREKAEKLWCDA